MQEEPSTHIRNTSLKYVIDITQYVTTQLKIQKFMNKFCLTTFF